MYLSITKYYTPLGQHVKHKGGNSTVKSPQQADLNDKETSASGAQWKVINDCLIMKNCGGQ